MTEEEIKRIMYVLLLGITILLTILICSIFTEPEVVVTMKGGELYYNEDGTVNYDINAEYEEANIFSENTEPAYKINLNTATREELMDLPSIGETTAERIIEYRENTPFENIEDLMNIKGIGERKFEDIKNFVYVD